MSDEQEEQEELDTLVEDAVFADDTFSDADDFTDEETRARAYRQQEVARLQFKLTREQGLRGDNTQAIAVFEAWEALFPIDEHGIPRYGFEYLA